MDIDLFSDIVKNLVIDNDEVAIPGLGTFVSELMPSSFSDKGYTINPPYRRLSFRQRWNEADTLLFDFYRKTNDTDEAASEKILSDFIAGLKETLQTRKAVQLPGLGRLRATKENTFFFIAEEDLDIYPYGFGLEPVSLKTHEETPEEVSTAVQELHELVMPLAEPQPQEPPKEQVQEPAQEQLQEQPEDRQEDQQEVTGARFSINYTGVIFWTVVAVLLFFGLFILLSRIAPGFIDSLLYTPEELQIINHPLS